jgi:hypothetical protein
VAGAPQSRGWYADPDPTAPPGRIRWWTGDEWGDYRTGRHSLWAINRLASLVIVLIVVSLLVGGYLLLTH